jgi:predicted PurR-regulated permease PerM
MSDAHAAGRAGDEGAARPTRSARVLAGLRAFGARVFAPGPATESGARGRTAEVPLARRVGSALSPVGGGAAPGAGADGAGADGGGVAGRAKAASLAGASATDERAAAGADGVGADGGGAAGRVDAASLGGTSAAGERGAAGADRSGDPAPAGVPAAGAPEAEPTAATGPAAATRTGTPAASASGADRTGSDRAPDARPADAPRERAERARALVAGWARAAAGIPQRNSAAAAPVRDAGVAAEAGPAAVAVRPTRSWFSIGFRVSLGALLAYWLVRQIEHITDIVMLVLLSLTLAVSLDPLVRLLNRWMARRWAVALTVLGVAALLAGLSTLFIAPVSHEISTLRHAVPTWLEELHDHHSTLGRLEDRYHVVDRAKADLAGGGVVDGVVGAGQVLAGTLTDVFLVVTLTVYLLVGLPALKGFCLRFVAGSRRAHAEELTDEILLRTGRYMLANVATSVIAGLATFVWLTAWGVPYPAALGVFVAFMDLIPVVGSTIGGIVVSLVALSVSWTAAIATAVFYVVFRVAEDYLITPRAMSFAVRVHPLVTILAVLVGGAVMGVIGALIAVPVAVAIGLVLDDAVFPRIDRR